MHRHLARHFVCHQRRHLGQQASKARRARRLLAHERELMLNQRMIEDVDVARQFDEDYRATYAENRDHVSG